MLSLRLAAFTALTALLTACSGTGPTPIPTLDLAPLVDAPSSSDTESLFDVKMVLDPAMTDSTLLDGSTDLSAIIDGNYYLASSRMMIFKPSGQCISSFDRQGNGPGEYGRYASFTANPATRGWIALSSTNDYGAFRYSASGQFEGCDTLAGLSFIHSLGSKWIAASNAFTKPDITFYYLDSNLEVTDSMPTQLRHLIFEVPGGRAAYSPGIYTSGSEAIIYWNDSIYSVTDPREGLKPLAAVDLGRYRTPDEMNRALEYERLKEFVDPNFLFNSKYYLAWFIREGRSCISFFDRSTGALVASLSSPEGSGTRGVPFTVDGQTVYLEPTSYSSGDTFYFIASEESMCDLKGSDDSNPAIFTVKIR
jgi:hypothetical protein